ncbi:MAG: NAD(+) diphosphatase [Lachnospiraceae bacterium]|nr:NAD(+) diphosphatase [Lachnospiraceae bacterium]
MIQEISPYHFDNSYIMKQPDENSVILLFQDDEILICSKEWSKGEVRYPMALDLRDTGMEYRYLFGINEVHYFLGIAGNQTGSDWNLRGMEFIRIDRLRGTVPKHQVYAGMTGYHLFHWYRDNVFCGRCKSRLIHDDKSRMLKCKNCGNEIYPKISPGIIVGIINGNKLLLTKYAGRPYKRYALVAGFNEIGESLEETVKREVMEEVGLRVKNIRYYKSQPWANSGTLLCGYFADLDGSAEITLEVEELAEAAWFSREEIQAENEDYSLTNEMIVKFKEGGI